MSDDCKSPGPVFLRTVIPDNVIRVILQIIRVDTNKNKRVNSDLGRAKQDKKKNSCFIPFPLRLITPYIGFIKKRTIYSWPGVMLPSDCRK